MILPFWVIRFCHAMKAMSDWVDEKCFPEPKADLRNPADLKMLHKSQEQCVKAAKLLQKLIRGCKSLERSQRYLEMIRNLKVTYGNTTQVSEWTEILMSDLRKRQNEILKNKCS